MEKRRGLVEVAAISLVVAAGVVIEHERRGVELRLVALAILLLGPFASSALVALGRARPAGVLRLVLVLASATGLAVYPVGRWAHALAGLACFGAALPPLTLDEKEPPRAPVLLEIAGALFGLAAAAAIVRAGLAADHEGLAVALALVLAVDAWGPGRGRTIHDVARKIAAWSFAAGTATLVSLPPGHPELDFHVGDPITTVAGAIALAAAAWLALGEIARRGLGGRSPAELVARRRRGLLRGIALAGTLALVWTLGEVFFRVVPNDYRETTTGAEAGSGWHEPGGRFVYEGPFLGHREEEGVRGTVVLWNKEGFHDTDHDVAKPKDRARVLVLGDSYVDGYMLPLDAIFHKKLEGELARATPPPATVETIAYGWAGWGQVQELAALKERGARFAPDLVVLEFLGGNDVRNNQPELEALAGTFDKGDALRAGRTALNYRLSFTWFLCLKTDLLLRRLHGLPPEIDSEVYREDGPRRALWEDGWRRTDELLGEAQAECRRLGADLVVVSFTGPTEVSTLLPDARPLEGYDMRLPSRRARAICEKRAIPFVDLLDRFGKRGGKDLARVHMKYDGHWSALGHAWAAEETSHFLVSETDLWQRALRHAQER